jgi:sigma-B regulation protein RsbU (phosphoserine phosphatase)
MTRLVVESGVDQGMVFPIGQSLVTMGRSASNTIQIVDRKMSRHHAEILYLNGDYVLRDLGSKNGTHVNEVLVTEERVLKSGDRIRVGDTVLVFESEPQESAPSDTTTRIVRITTEPFWGKPTDTMAAVTVPLAPPEEPEVEIKDPHHRLGMLYRVTDTIRSIFGLDELLQKIVEIIYEVLQPDNAFIMLKDERSGELVPRVVKRRESEEEEIMISRSIVDKSLGEKLSVLVSDATSDERFKSSDSIIRHKIRSAICTPLIYKDEILGTIYIDSKSRLISYGKDEMELLTSISGQAAVAIANAKLHARLIEQHKLDRELEIARSIQMNLLPKSYPQIAGYEVSAMSLPAKKVGGDYYDFLEVGKEEVGFVIADVSGKGVAAAILAATLRASIQTNVRESRKGVAKIVSQMNEITCRDTTNNMFATMIFGVLNSKDGAFEYANAGHCRPLIFDNGGKVASLEKGSCFLGLAPNIEYATDKVTLKPGDTMVLYTDGVTDTMNRKGDLYGLNRLIECMKKNLGLAALELRDAICEDVWKYREGAEQFDDFTLVLVRRLSESADSGKEGSKQTGKQA